MDRRTFALAVPDLRKQRGKSVLWFPTRFFKSGIDRLAMVGEEKSSPEGKWEEKKKKRIMKSILLCFYIGSKKVPRDVPLALVGPLQ